MSNYRTARIFPEPSPVIAAPVIAALTSYFKNDFNSDYYVAHMRVKNDEQCNQDTGPNKLIETIDALKREDKKNQVKTYFYEKLGETSNKTNNTNNTNTSIFTNGNKRINIGDNPYHKALHLIDKIISDNTPVLTKPESTTQRIGHESDATERENETQHGAISNL